MANEALRHVTHAIRRRLFRDCAFAVPRLRDCGANAHGGARCVPLRASRRIGTAALRDSRGLPRREAHSMLGPATHATDADSAIASTRVDGRDALQIGVLPLRLLRRSGGDVLAALPLVLVSTRAQVRFRSGFGLQASGPLAALFLPAGFRVEPVDADQAGAVFALTLTRRGIAAPHGRRELLSSRLPIGAAAFDALCALDPERACVLDPRCDARAAALSDWIAAAPALGPSRARNGHGVSRRALRAWSDRITGIEQALCGDCEIEAASALAATLQDAAARRRFARVTGCGPQRYRRELARRVATSAGSDRTR
jgi:hypothetical protein